MVSERPAFRFPAAFVVLGMVTLATINGVRSSNWFNRPDRDDSFLTAQSHSRLSSLVFSPDGQFIATAGTDYTVRIWEAHSGRELRILRGHTDHRVLAVAFSPDGSWLAAGGRDGTIRIWDPRAGRQIQTLRGHRDRVMALAISPDGSLIATGSRDHSVKVWDARTFRERTSLGGVNEGFGFVRSIAFDGGRRLVGFGDWFGSVRVWNHETGEVRLLGHFGRAIYGVAFSPDGRLLASAGHDHRVRLFNVATGSPQHVFEGHAAAVTSVAFSPGGHLLASGSDDRTIRLWNVDKREAERTFLGHAQRLNSIAFSPDGSYLASASADETFKFWKIRP
jgi:WD40 repeat protein